MRDKIDVMWVGISNKPEMSPLSSDSPTGKIINEIENKLRDINLSSYKTNLVKVAPINNDGKLRYPNQEEIDNHFPLLLKELEKNEPKLVFLMGKIVIKNFEKKIQTKFKSWDGYSYHKSMYCGMNFIPIHHPSYISVYRKKEKEIYVNHISNLIREVIN